MRVTIGSTGPDGGGRKTGFRSSGVLVFPAALRHSRQGQAKSAAFCRKPLRRSGAAGDGNPPPTFVWPTRSCGGATFKTLARPLLQSQSCRFALTYDSCAASMAFFAHFLAVSWQINGSACPGTVCARHGVFPGQIRPNPVKPSQTQSNHFFALTLKRRHPYVSVDRVGTALLLRSVNRPGQGGYCVRDGGKKGRAGSPPYAPEPWRRRMPAAARGVRALPSKTDA